ncbi:cobyrinate a,c-diamide synthase [Massilia sp. YMA4]|uniref:cobyrinate a,c-diamide synthase n=1 Tax=Massilia sp. YMA4 TaxID=1593482 RepID=UPI000DD11A37|nr:cobyrinate a,c-diamide synthase [Massilia sp. YMA4]AXA93960.1 cobyrinate a,c-diamide synthase [Massilia sp. YMA4]
MGARAVLIAAVSSGQGKTTVTAALARKLARAGERVRVFKCGPDFIDPMVLQRASGAPVETLDLWMVGRERCHQLLAQAALEADTILIEGVMGLYDGTPSAADLAREFGVPVLAVIDAGAMAQTAGALVHGLRDYGPVEMAGVIANRVGSAGHAAMVQASLRGIPLFGTLPKQGRSLPERHLGLVLPHEVEGIDDLLDELATQMTFDSAAWATLPALTFAAPASSAPTEPLLAGRTIAIARDESFLFVYHANTELLRQLGAHIVYFAPLQDDAVPADADAVYLPGGYPELHCERLAGATRWRASIQAAHAAGKPIVAECGGMMALADALADGAGHDWPMAGLLPGRVTVQKKLAGLGPQALVTPQGILRGHTFHYSRLESTTPVFAHTSKNPSGAQGEAVYRVGSLTASYFHAYFPSNPAAVAALFSRSDA